MSAPVSVRALVEQVRALGLRAGDTVVVHCAFRAVRPVEGGPDGLIVALLDAVGADGNLVMPTMTGGADEELFDPDATPTRHMGIVAETFWRRAGVLRSDHPTSSFAACGPRAAEITAPQPLSPVHGPDSPIGRVWALDGWVLLLGVDHTADTTLHLAEVLAPVPYGVRKRCLVREPHGAARWAEFVENDHCCRRFALADGWLRADGRQREGVVGRAHARLIRARDVVEAACTRLRADATLFLHPRGGGCGSCDEAWASVPR